MRDSGPAIGVVRGHTGLSQSKARRLFELGKVYLDGAPCLDWRTAVEAGVEVSVDTDRRRPDRLIEVTGASIVYQDNAVVVADKPAGIVSVPPTSTGEPTLLDRLIMLTDSRLLPLHRLDRDTSGLMVFGKEGADLEPLRRQFASHQAKRLYYAVVHGTARDCTLAGEIDVTRRGGRPMFRHAVTHVRVLRTADQLSLVQCTPETGRWHQLRIQLANAGWPIVGETLHCPPDSPLPRATSRLALQSYSLSLLHPTTGDAMQWEIPLDAELSALLDQHRTDPIRGE